MLQTGTAAMVTGTSHNQQNTSSGVLDMASVLSKIQLLEREKAELSHQILQKDNKLAKLTESKRAEMQQVLETTISKFLQDLQTKVKTLNPKLMYAVMMQI